MNNAEDSLKNKVSYDAGWNDPPLYSYESMNPAGQSNPNKKVNILTKRVAYPMGEQKVILGGMNPTLPPSTTTAPLPPSCGLMPGNSGTTLCPEAKANDEALIDKDHALSKVREIFKEVLENCSELQQNSDEINRRLSTMFKMWEDDRLNQSVHRRLLELVEALKNNNLDRADHLHVCLAVDYPSVCSSWIPGIRRLVQHLKSCRQPNNQSNEAVSEPLPNLTPSLTNEEVFGN